MQSQQWLVHTHPGSVHRQRVHTTLASEGLPESSVRIQAHHPSSTIRGQEGTPAALARQRAHNKRSAQQTAPPRKGPDSCLEARPSIVAPSSAAPNVPSRTLWDQDVWQCGCQSPAQQVGHASVSLPGLGRSERRRHSQWEARTLRDGQAARQARQPCRPWEDHGASDEPPTPPLWTASLLSKKDWDPAPPLGRVFSVTEAERR
ncbi:hypothetical protein PTTG_28194 [Puccinia triticina 1-1 BBBD Race 1]|uniref:Uncharacterized protein n=1 Tax=Puccinia triticina (isolate 1-1 / race 1 (BBBD)) TaxID=630390 RepID=A0A180GDW9_PUCT1|nr:hypothetical protein PTTG_28194 [Puccinia triticina 1-1 BBBD Race 1]WAR63321.1 hypothetical protein PtB15_18B404 [Puccinia triticina]